MSLFVDASAIVAFLMAEPEGDALAAEIAQDKDPLWSAMTCWEVVSALKNNFEYTIEGARRETEDVAAAMRLRLVTIGAEELRIALEAYQRFGKGVHPARLNFGDCFSYACAKTNGARLLYKGEDFARTDLA